MKKLVSFFDKLIVKILMSTIPTIWFAFFSVFATQSAVFINEEGKFTPLSIIVNIIMLAVMFIFAVGITIEQSVKRTSGIKSEKMYKHLLSQICSGDNYLRNRQKDLLQTNIKNNIAVYSSTIEQILKNLIACLAEITQIDYDNFVATYFYQERKSNDWKEISSDKGCKGVDIAKLLSDKQSVLYQLIKKNEFIFISSKEKAIKKEQYISDNRDKEQVTLLNQPMGSIFGVSWKVLEPDGNIFFDNIIVIATYGEEICTEKDFKTKKAIIESVLKIFEKQFWQAAFTFKLLDK